MVEVKLLSLLDETKEGLTLDDLVDILGIKAVDLKVIVDKLITNGVLTISGNRYIFSNERYHLGKIRDDFKLVTKDKQIVRLDTAACKKDDYVVYMASKGKHVKYRVVYNISINKHRIGEITNIGGINYLVTEEKKMHIINDKRVTNEIMVEYREENGQIEIISILGAKDSFNTAIKMIAIELGIVMDYPEEVEIESRDIPTEVTQKDILGRKDLRDDATVTIDNSDTNDIDDAVYYVGKNQNNHDVVRISIADLQSYVKKGSAIDLFARLVTTSVYSKDGNARHMFPPKLSKGICSLNPDVDRLARTYEIAIDDKGNIIFEESKMYLSVIRSKKKMDKEFVNKVLDGEIVEDYEPFRDNLTDLYRVSRMIRQRRIRNGAIDFGTIDRKFILDETGVPIKIKNIYDTKASDLIEDLMLLTGEFQAKIYEQRGIKGIFRVEEPPEAEKIDDIIDALELHNIHIKKKSVYNSKDIQEILTKIEGKKFALVFKERIIRSMTRARYSTNNIGHCGLALSGYAQCTSSMRRYGDNYNHEIDYKIDKNEPQSPGEILKLEAFAGHCTREENKVKKFEREVDKYYNTWLMEQFIGQNFEAFIFSIKKDGIELLFPNGTQGFLRYCDSLAKFDASSYHQIKISSFNKSAILRLGDSIGVTLVECNLRDRKMYFKLKEEKVLVKK